ncbi:hypothetical protein BH23ACT6_BH23ACT6_07700 [soil metagenome]
MGRGGTIALLGDVGMAAPLVANAVRGAFAANDSSFVVRRIGFVLPRQLLNSSTSALSGSF